MKLGLMLGMIVSPIVLGIMYFGLFTPLSFITKIFGRDELNLKDNNQKTYWIATDERSQEAYYFEKQF